MALHHTSCAPGIFNIENLFLFPLSSSHSFAFTTPKKVQLRFLHLVEKKWLRDSQCEQCPRKLQGLMAFLRCDQGGHEKAHSAKVKGPKEGHALIITSVLRGKRKWITLSSWFYNVWSGNNKFSGNASNGVEWETHWKQPEFNDFYEQVYYYCLFMNDGKF